MILAIPTLGRIGKQRTLGLMPSEIAEVVHVWTDEAEIAEHKRQPYAAKVGTWHAAPRGIALVWQAMLEWCLANDEPWLWMIEDDFYRLSKWRSLTDPRLTPARFEEIVERFLECTGRAGAAFIGLMNRAESRNSFPEPEGGATRIHGCWAVHVPSLSEIGFRFDEFGPRFFMADFHCQLRLLEAGYRSVRIQDYCWDQHASNAKGGASDQRTLEHQRATAEQLVAAHPQTVRLREVKSKTWGAMNLRVDVLVHWKKAFREV
jgi:hypothetical protein